MNKFTHQTDNRIHTKLILSLVQKFSFHALTIFSSLCTGEQSTKIHTELTIEYTLNKKEFLLFELMIEYIPNGQENNVYLCFCFFHELTIFYKTNHVLTTLLQLSAQCSVFFCQVISWKAVQEISGNNQSSVFSGNRCSKWSWTDLVHGGGERP